MPVHLKNIMRFGYSNIENLLFVHLNLKWIWKVALLVLSVCGPRLSSLPVKL